MSSTDPNRTPVSTATLILLCACFILSGIAALIYQTAWTRQFAIVFGTSELAIATVLAAYMGGLAFGAWLAERFLPRVTRPVFTYAVLELGIAGSAIFAVPALLWVANLALQAFFGSRTREESLEWLAKLEVGFAPVNTLHEATLDPQVEARELLLRDALGRAHLAPPIRFAAEPARPHLREPLLGEHTDEILAELDAPE